MSLVIYLIICFQVLVVLLFATWFDDIPDFIDRKIEILKNIRSKLFEEYKELIDPFDCFEATEFQTIIRVSELDNNRKLHFLKSAFEKHGSELSTLKIQLDYLKTGVKRGLTKKGVSNGLNIVNDRVGEIFIDILEEFYKFERDALTQEENELRSMLNEIQ